jgi:hypothetical protein
MNNGETKTKRAQVVIDRQGNENRRSDVLVDEKSKDSITTTSSDDDKYNRNDIALKTLGERQPDATEQECRRFLKARKGNIDGASTQLEFCLFWRAHLMGVDSDTPIIDDNNEDNGSWEWQHACYGAIKSTDPTATMSLIPKLPCLMYFYRSTNTGGNNRAMPKDQQKRQKRARYTK